MKFNKKRMISLLSLLAVIIALAVVRLVIPERDTPPVSQNSTNNSSGSITSEHNNNANSSASSQSSESAKNSSSPSKNGTKTSTTQPPATSSGGGNDEALPAYASAYLYAGLKPVLANTKIAEWNLLLVNRHYILPENYDFELAPAISSQPGGQKLDKRVAPFFNDMYNAAAKEGVYLTPVSGYRSVARQRNNFENRISAEMSKGLSKTKATLAAAEVVLPPGTSEHNAGLAMDIGSLKTSFANGKEFKWLQENAHKYGFILRYSKEKMDITQITDEPWHWRYVGVEHATKIKNSGLCFEEYLETL